MSAGWIKYRQRAEKMTQENSLVRLIIHFVSRSFRGGAESDSDELDFSTGLLLVLLPIPGTFVAIFFYDKYSTLLQFLRRDLVMNPYVASLGDEYMFVVVSMVVTGILAVWRWDSILLDKRDFANLAHLPVSYWRLFSANLFAIIFLTGLFAFEVNIGSTLIFPVVVSSSYPEFSIYLGFALGHAVGVILASVFTFVAIVALIGLLMACVPYKVFRRLSKYLRILLIVFFLSLMMTTFAVAPLVGGLPQQPNSFVLYLPPVWFLGLCESLRHSTSPIFHSLSSIGLIAVVVAIVVAFIAYTMSFRRCFLSIPESVEFTESQNGFLIPLVLQLANKFYLRGPTKRACFAFVIRTLARSERHFTALGAMIGMGFLLSAQTMLNAGQLDAEASGSIPNPALLSIPLILIYCFVVGLRFVFEIPADLRANWIFKLLVDPAASEGMALGRTLTWTVLAPCLLLLCFPIYLYRWGWLVAVLHLGFLVVMSHLLTETLMVRLRKIPFTCSLPLFKANAFVIIFALIIGFYLFARAGAFLEYLAFIYPLRTIMLVVFLTVWWLILTQYHSNILDMDKRLIFEEGPVETVQLLGLENIK